MEKEELNSFPSELFSNQKYQPREKNVNNQYSIHLPNQHRSRKDKFKHSEGANVSDESPPIALKSLSLQTLCYLGIYQG